VTIYGINYSPEPVGIGPYTAELAGYLAANGHQVRVITTFPHYPSWTLHPSNAHRMRATSSEHEVQVRRLWARMPRPMTGAQRMLFELSYLGQALVSGPGHADVIVGVTPGLGSGLAAAFHGRLRRRRVVIVVQDLAGRGLQQSGMPAHRLLSRLATGAERLAVRSADRVISISDSFVPELVSMGVSRARISVLPNWGRVDSEPRPADPSIELNSLVTVLHAGSLGLKQGLEQLVDAGRLAHERSLPWRFLLVGDGSERSRLEDLARGLPTVEFRDPVSDDDLPALLSSADVLLVSQNPANIDMSFPSKLTAYFGAGRPVVAAVPPTGVVADFLHRTGTGFVTPAGDPPALLRAITTVVDDPTLSRRLAVAAGEHLRSAWSQEALLPQWAAAILDDDQHGVSIERDLEDIVSTRDAEPRAS